MPQSPFLVDQIQVSPGVTGTRLINSDLDGNLQFQDATISPVLLSALVGARNITGVYIVGRAGGGAAYASIQGALDAIPDSSSETSPSLVLVYPGVYSENLTLQKDGVTLQALGLVTLENAAAGDTLTISASTGATPKSVRLLGVRVTNDDPASACVRIIGADTFATGSLTVTAAPLTAGDEITIGGVTLTGIAGTRTSGYDNFNVLGGSPAAVAAEITAALSDTGNSFAALVGAEVLAGVITLTATEAGSGGNAITLATNTANITLSGITLTGGGAANTEVFSAGLVMRGCDIVAAGAGGYQVRSDVSGPIEITGGSFRGSASDSLTSVANCTRLLLSGVDSVFDVELAYDTGSDQPVDPTSEYLVSGCSAVGDVLVNLVGEGSFTISGCPQVGAVEVAGDQVFAARNSTLGVLTLSGTIQASLQGSPRAGVALGGGTPTLSESNITGFLTFAGSSSEVYSFEVDQPDTDYVVLLDTPSVAVTAAVTSRTVSGFTVETSAPVTGDVNFSVMRQVL